MPGARSRRFKKKTNHKWTTKKPLYFDPETLELAQEQENELEMAKLNHMRKINAQPDPIEMYTQNKLSAVEPLEEIKKTVDVEHLRRLTKQTGMPYELNEEIVAGEDPAESRMPDLRDYSGPAVQRTYYTPETPSLTEYGNDPYVRSVLPNNEYTQAHRKIGKLMPGDDLGIIYPTNLNGKTTSGTTKRFQRKVSLREQMLQPDNIYNQLQRNAERIPYS